MRVIDAETVDRVLTFPELVDTLRTAFQAATVTPVRHHHTVSRPGAADATLLLMPAWNEAADGYIGIKVASVFPDNAARRRPSVYGTYLLLAGDSGEPLAVLDGSRLTLWRTAAASALAASYLAAPGARRMTMIGAGALAPQLIAAHAAVRPIAEVMIWNRTPAHAATLAEHLDRPGLKVSATTDLEAAVAGADVVSAATLSTEPLIRGDWLKPGTYVDLVGAFRPDMREADDDTVRRARVYVDTRAGATTEGGDIVQPLASGVLACDDLMGDLFDLTRGNVEGRRSDDEITLFKSVGTALEDLAAAVHVYRAHSDRGAAGPR